MKRLKLVICCILTCICLFGCKKNNDDLKNEENNNSDIHVEEMVIKPTKFSEETNKVLELIDNEIQFYDISINESAKSFEISIWNYVDEKWEQGSISYGEIEYLEEQIAIRITDSTYELFHISDTGHTKMKSDIQVTFDNSTSIIKSKLSNEEKIELNKEIVIFYKIGTNKTSFSTSEFDEDFREFDCNAGIVVTITIFDK